MSSIVYTIKDVASQAKVSPGTASRAINNKGYINPRTKARVLKVASELNYKANFNAKSLVSKKTHIIALVIPSIDNSYYARLLKGVQDSAEEKGFFVMCCPSHGDSRKKIDLLKTFYDIRVDGIVVCVEESESCKEYNDFLKMLNRTGTPVVLTGPRNGISGIDIVRAENEISTCRAVEYLLELNHKEIAFIGGDKNSVVEMERLKGYMCAIKNAGLKVNSVLIKENDFTYESGYSSMKSLLSAEKLPTAVFAANDVIAIGAMAAAADNNFKVPEDISIMGFDDIAMASMIRPQLTTIAQPNYEIGKMAADLLLERVSEKAPTMARNVTLETSLVIRKSAVGI